ncbi:MAG: M24 family metallopeptidase, partial [Candidatus Heimdallarchaeaceae archaeon]
HYSPIIQDESVIPEESIVKVDAGVSVDGYLTDAARTFIFDSKWRGLQEIAEIAFEKALSVIEPNGSVFKVGEVVEKTLTEKGFKPVRNLSGHLMKQYSLHGGVSIPNYNVPKNARDKSHKFIPGNAYAVEPFVTTGAGQVFDDDNTTIYRHYRKVDDYKIPENIKAIYNHIEKNFNCLPFSWRWVYNAGFSLVKIKKARNILLQKQVIHGYPVLIEKEYAPVTQVEETLFVGKKGIFVLTRK